MKLDKGAIKDSKGKKVHEPSTRKVATTYYYYYIAWPFCTSLKIIQKVVMQHVLIWPQLSSGFSLLSLRVLYLFIYYALLRCIYS